MNSGEDTGFITIPQWENIPDLVHGFGKGNTAAAGVGGMEECKNMIPVFLRQVHSRRVHNVKRVTRSIPMGDALLTDRPGILLVVKTADCLPVLIVDKDRRAVAAVHCGWRGTAQKILQCVINAMRRDFKSRPDRLLVGMGPCIGPECYEVGPELPSEFQRRGLPASVFRPKPDRPGKFLLDLKEANLQQLRESGVQNSHIVIIEECTRCRPDLASFRREGDKAGRMLNVIGLKKRH